MSSCPEKSQVKGSLIITFDLNGPTQKCQHTLDLVLSYSLSVLNLEIVDVSFSDHRSEGLSRNGESKPAFSSESCERL